MRIPCLAVLALLLATAVAHADPPVAPAKPPDLGNYKLDREKGDIPLEVGRRFMTDLGAYDAELAASVEEAVRFKIQQDETVKFTRQRGYVMWAYGAAWTVLVCFALGLFARQRSLNRALAELEARVAKEKP
jgi:hypothetical protein